MYIALAVIGSIWVVLWLVLYFANLKKYEAQIAQVDGSEYFMKDLFMIGYALKDFLQIDTGSMSVLKKERKISELYGSRMARQLVLTDIVAQLTYIAAFTPIGILLTVITQDLMWIMVVILFTGFLVVYVEYDKNSKVQKRREKINQEFPHIISQLALLINAGMPLREALSVSAKKEDSILCQEIRVLVNDMANGIPDYQALGSFADRCGTDSIRKFASLVTQNVKKGSAELASSLMELSGEVWRGRVSLVKEAGEKASAKLMVPIIIIFGGILLMVVAPMFRNMSF